MGMLTMSSILFVVTLVMTSIGLHRHRLAGGHCMSGRSAVPSPAAAKNEMPGQPQAEPPVASA
jgi:hypothetical protein